MAVTEVFERAELLDGLRTGRYHRLVRQLGLTDLELARALGVPRSTVSSWLMGGRRPSPEVGERLHAMLKTLERRAAR